MNFVSCDASIPDHIRTELCQSFVARFVDYDFGDDD